MDDAPNLLQQKYSAGFFFDPSGEQVILVKKNRPKWQAGKLNGIGGHIEPGETPLDAMVREFYEETDVQTMHRDWRPFATVGGNGFIVHFFETRSAFPIYRTVTDEDIGIYRVDQLLRGSYAMIPNLRWLIPLALDKDRVIAAVSDPSLPGEG